MGRCADKNSLAKTFSRQATRTYDQPLGLAYIVADITFGIRGPESPNLKLPNQKIAHFGRSFQI